MKDLPRYLQLLWDRQPERRRGPKPGRTIEEIGAAAVAIADEHGLDAVSMKGVAKAIGLTTMSLYRYVDSKDELQAVMMDVALGSPSPTADTAGWRERVSVWARAISERRLAHPWTVNVTQAAPPLTPNALAWTEAGLEALAETPLTSQQRLSAMLAIDGWALNHVRQTTQMGLRGEVDPDSPQGAYLTYIGMLVDPDRFPLLAAIGAEGEPEEGEDFFEEEFAYGLDLLLDGISALIDRAV